MFSSDGFRLELEIYVETDALPADGVEWRKKYRLEDKQKDTGNSK